MNAFKILVLSLAFPALTWAQSQIGIGAIIGNPTGVSGELVMNDQEAIDMALAWSSGSDAGMHVHGDYLLTRPQIGKAGTMPVDLYYGIGARFMFIRNGKHEDKVAFGPRAPLGVAMRTQDPNLKFFAELALVLDLVPDTEADLDIGIGVRYYF